MSGAATTTCCCSSRVVRARTASAALLEEDIANATATSTPASGCATHSQGTGGCLERLPRWVWRVVVLLLTIIWATNFASIKDIISQPGVDAQLYAVTRFTLGAVVMAPCLLQISSRRVLLRSVECGLWVSAGYIAQAIGLITTTAGKSSFICSLTVVLVAMVASVMEKKFDVQAVAAAFVAVVGVGFLELAGSEEPVIGDLISLVQPIGFGMSYIRLEQIMADSPKDANAVTAMKMLTIAVSSWIYYVVTQESLPDFGPVLAAPTAITGLLWTGLVTTALGTLVETVAFRYVDATSVSLILTTEPLWACLFAVWLINESFAWADGVGGILIVLACLLKELPLSRLSRRSTPAADTEANVGRQEQVPV